MWGFVPAAGGILADWGATVIKVEHPDRGDPVRGLISSSMAGNGFPILWEIPNRGKKSVGIDLAVPEGREVLYRLVKTCDVFITSFLPAARRRLGIDKGDIWEQNPRIVYARGSGQGVRGPESERGGWDLSTFWSRGGAAAMTTSPGATTPTRIPAAAYGDLTSGMALAGAVAAALVQQARTGEGVAVDVSLLNTSMWAMSSAIASSNLFGPPPNLQTPIVEQAPRPAVGNPLTAPYRTKDGRFLALYVPSNQQWIELCGALGEPGLVDDPRFVDEASRVANNADCYPILEEIFLRRTLDEWRTALEPIEAVWGAIQFPDELLTDPQVLANGYMGEIEKTFEGRPVKLVTNPAQFNEEPPELGVAPELGEHTDEVLMDIGLTSDELTDLKVKGAIL
jgi:crotonobetainyl-CoA:carnitine CoA-transferase CaiB-like acyl-CoA transferase